MSQVAVIPTTAPCSSLWSLWFPWLMFRSGQQDQLYKPYIQDSLLGLSVFVRLDRQPLRRRQRPYPHVSSVKWRWFSHSRKRAGFISTKEGTRGDQQTTNSHAALRQHRGSLRPSRGFPSIATSECTRLFLEEWELEEGRTALEEVKNVASRVRN